MRTQPIFNILLMVGLLAPSTAGAMVTVVDNFTGGAQTLTLGAVGTVTDTGTAPAAELLGGERSITFVVSANPLTLPATVQANAAGSGVLSFSTGPLTVSSAVLSYRGAGGAGLGGEDLTIGNADALQIDVTFMNVPTLIFAEIEDTSGRIMLATVSHAGGVSSPGTVQIAFDQFTGDPATDLTQVNGISIGFAPQVAGGDLVVSGVGTGVLPIPIPEPGTAVLLVLSMAGWMARRGR